MKSVILWGLVALNALLVVALALQYVHPNAAYGQARRPPDYVLIPCAVNGQPTDLICVVDTTNGVFGALAYDDNAKKLLPLPPSINLDQVFDRAMKK